MSEAIRVTALEKLLARLEKRYGNYEVPPCPVCGNERSIAASGGWERTWWACSPHEDDPDRPGYLRRREGYEEMADKEEWPHGHYTHSRWQAPNFPDYDILRLVQLVRAMKKRLEHAE